MPVMMASTAGTGDLNGRLAVGEFDSQPNSLNVIRTDRSRIGIECWAWQPERAQFDRLSDENYERTPEGWTAAK